MAELHKNLTPETSVIEAGTTAAQTLPTASTIRKELFLDLNGFAMLPQGPATNHLSRIKTSSKRHSKQDEVTGAVTTTYGGLTVYIPKFRDLKLMGWRASTHQLLDFICAKAHQTGYQNIGFAFPLEEYMNLRGIKTVDDARKIVDEDLKTIFYSAITFEDKRGKEYSLLNVHVLDIKGEIENSIVILKFSQTYFDYLKTLPPMPFSSTLWGLNHKLHPHSYFLGRYLHELKNMNSGKANEDLISVQKLFEVCPDLPSKDEVMKGNRNLKARIMRPLIRDLKALKKDFDFDFRLPTNSKKITPTDALNLSFDVFELLYVNIKWKNYPDQTARLEKAKAKKQAAKPRKTSKKKTETKESTSNKNA